MYFENPVTNITSFVIYDNNFKDKIIEKEN